VDDQQRESSDSPYGCDCILEPSPPPHESVSPSLPRVKPPDNTEPDAAAITDEAADVPPVRPGRALKLVVSFQPRDGQSCHTLLALGADGCDPLFRSVDVDALTAALAMIPALIAEAEARWQIQPRYASARPSRARRSAPAPDHPTDVPAPDTPTPESAGSGPTGPTPGTKPTIGQLTLFG
jgi:hypothetical protein